MSGKKGDYFLDLLPQPLRLLQLRRLERVFVDGEQSHLLFHTLGCVLLELLHQMMDEALLLQMLLLPFVVVLLQQQELLDEDDDETSIPIPHLILGEGET